MDDGHWFLLFVIPISLLAVIGFYVALGKMVGKLYRKSLEESSTDPEDNNDEHLDRSEWHRIGDHHDLTPFSNPDELSWGPGYRGAIRGLPIRIRLESRPSAGRVETATDIELPFPWDHFDKATSFSLSVPVSPAIPMTGIKEIRSCWVEAPIQPRLKQLDEEVDLSLRDGHLEVRSSYWTSLNRTLFEHIDRTVTEIAEGFWQGLTLEVGNLPEELALEVHCSTDVLDGRPTTRLEVRADFGDEWPADLEIRRRSSGADDETKPVDAADFDRLFDISGAEDSDHSLVDNRLRHQLLELAEDFDDVSIADGWLTTRTDVAAFETSDDEMLEHFDEAVERTGGAALEIHDALRVDSVVETDG